MLNFGFKFGSMTALVVVAIVLWVLSNRKAATKTLVMDPIEIYGDPNAGG